MPGFNVSGKNDDHRRELIRQRLEFLAGIMGIEVLGYAVIATIAQIGSGTISHVSCTTRMKAA